MNTVEYLNEVKRALSVESDYALAKKLGLSKQAIGNYMQGKSAMSDEVACKVAAILGKHAGIVMLDMHREREKNPEVQAVWSAVMEKFSLGFNSLLNRRTPRLI